ncbi:MAG: hypothetical protein SFY81_16920 [Verrucomicrobiota bacterium]|nr:hypothetical protein [Verrucomicrobiota bacterium]
MSKHTQTFTPVWLLLRINTIQAGRRFLDTLAKSRLLTLLILGFTSGYVAFSFWLFYRGLTFIERFPGLGTLLTERLLYLLFGFLFILLLFSNLVISYTNLFRNKETSFLLTLPIPHETIFRWKFVESLLLASWAFIFLIAPLVAAYGLTRGVPWHFYALTTVMIGIFVILPGVMGAWASMFLARFMDRRGFQIGLLLIASIGLITVTFFMKPEPITDDVIETRVLAVLDRMLAKTRFTLFPLLPSYWLTSSILNWAESAISTAGFYALVLLSHALFFTTLGTLFSGSFFYEAVSNVNSRSNVFSHWGWFQKLQSRRQKFAYPPGFVETFLRSLRFLKSDDVAILTKDIRVFWRDTTQWGQSIVLFGLLAAYILNLRHFSQQLTNPFWVNLVAYLNLGACSLNLATLTTRFIFAQFSLEGKRVWIVGLAPMGLKRMLKVKFGLATTASLILTLGLVYTSCHMLRLPLDRTLYFTFGVAVMTFVLNGLAIGLGVLYPNFREDNPSKIVSGFGGTFCLVMSFLYIVISIVFLAMGAPWARSGTQPLHLLLLGWSGFAFVSFLVGWIPFKLALRKVTHFEISI